VYATQLAVANSVRYQVPKKKGSYSTIKLICSNLDLFWLTRMLCVWLEF